MKLFRTNQHKVLIVCICQFDKICFDFCLLSPFWPIVQRR